MANTFKLSIVTPERIVFNGIAESIIAPGIMGYIGILAHHAPLMTALSNGKLTVRLENGQEALYDIHGGMLEVSSNQVTILSDSIAQDENDQ